MFPIRHVRGGVIGLLVVVVWLLLPSPPSVGAVGRTQEPICHVFKIGRRTFVIPFRLPSALVQWHLKNHRLDHRPFTFYPDGDGDDFGAGTAGAQARQRRGARRTAPPREKEPPDSPTPALLRRCRCMITACQALCR
jgi:hypothetical protein